MFDGKIGFFQGCREQECVPSVAKPKIRNAKPTSCAQRKVIVGRRRRINGACRSAGQAAASAPMQCGVARDVGLTAAIPKQSESLWACPGGPRCHETQATDATHDTASPFPLSFFKCRTYSKSAFNACRRRLRESTGSGLGRVRQRPVLGRTCAGRLDFGFCGVIQAFALIMVCLSVPAPAPPAEARPARRRGRREIFSFASSSSGAKEGFFLHIRKRVRASRHGHRPFAGAPPVPVR